MFGRNSKGTLEKINNSLKPSPGGVGLKVDGGTVNNGKRYIGVSIIGRKKQVFTTNSSAVPLLVGGEYIYAPDNPTLLQISSTSLDDTDGGDGARTVILRGLNQVFKEVQEEITLNGQTPASSVNQYFSVIINYVESSGVSTAFSGPNLGEIYISPSGTATTLGKPDLNIMSVMDIGEGVGYCGCITIGPTASFYISDLSLSSVRPSGGTQIIYLDVVQKQDNVYRTVATFFTSTAQETLQLKQDGLVDLVFNKKKKTDIFLVCRRVGGGSDDVELEILISGQLVVSE